MSLARWVHLPSMRARKILRIGEATAPAMRQVSAPDFVDIWDHSSPDEDSGRVHISMIPDFKAATIMPFLTQNVASGSTIYTDGLKSFSGLSEAGFKHIARNQPLRSELRKGAKSAVPLADRAIGNLQQWLIGTYHGVSKAQLQVYLNEFVFRRNRRKTPAAAFQTLLGLGTGQRSTKYEQIRGARDLNPNALGSAEATG